VPRLEVAAAKRADQEVVSEAVEAVYDIRIDDRNLREIRRQPDGERGRFFDALRKNYPVRREFQNTTVVLDEPRARLRATLEGVGFRIGQGG
jgi:erythronate-4-phosphate dehydrogenase